MKRSLLCSECAKRFSRIDPYKQVTSLDAALSAQELVVHVYGEAHQQFSCDLCGADIPQGSKAMAESIVPIGQHYFEWEADYVTT